MKKLMIALAAVAMATVVQAATVTWGSGTIYTPGSEGAFTTTKAAANAVTYYLWTMDATTYASTTLDSIAKLDTSTATATGKNSALGGTVSYKDTTSYDAGDTINWAILFTYKDGDNKDWYIANKGTGTVNDLGGALSFGNLASSSSAYATVSGWTAVPEPTSGLLMLLGMAGLALRRRRA
jgi:hypothetical protein